MRHLNGNIRKSFAIGAESFRATSRKFDRLRACALSEKRTGKVPRAPVSPDNRGDSRKNKRKSRCVRIRHKSLILQEPFRSETPKSFPKVVCARRSARCRHSASYPPLLFSKKVPSSFTSLIGQRLPSSRAPDVPQFDALEVRGPVHSALQRGVSLDCGNRRSSGRDC